MNIAAKKIDVASEAAALLDKMGVAKDLYTGGDMPSFSPVTGEKIASLKTVSAAEAAGKIEKADEAFRAWRLVPAPKRGELVRLLGEELRAFKADLGRLVSIEAGKIPSEGLGEVQEMIDICDFAVGLSRQLYGLTIATERPGHRMMETWHPLGVVGIISAFNFPSRSGLGMQRSRSSAATPSSGSRRKRRRLPRSPARRSWNAPSPVSATLRKACRRS